MNTLDMYFEKGRKEGFEKGAEKGKEQIIQNLSNTGKFRVTGITNFAGVQEAFAEKVHVSMNKKN